MSTLSPTITWKVDVATWCVLLRRLPGRMIKVTTVFSGMVKRERNELKCNHGGSETVFPAKEKSLKVRNGLRVKMKSRIPC